MIPNKSVILIVDDKPANVLALENLLAAYDRVLLTAADGNTALKTTFEKHIDLIILDVQMPGMNGFEVAQVLKSNNRTKNIPIIFATAESRERNLMMKGYEEGAIDYLFKPLDPEIVKAKVTVLLKIQLQQKELVEKNSSLQKSALLINNSADIIGIIDAATLRIEEINNAFTVLAGYSFEEAYAHPLVDFFAEEERAMVEDFSRQHNDRLSFESRIRCKDGDIKWLDWKVVVMNNKWFVNARDITEVKQAELIRNYLAAVVKQSGDAIYIHNNEGRIISWNEGAEKIYGYSESEALQLNIWNIIPEYMQQQISGTINDVFDGDKVNVLETKRITKHGKLIDVLFSASVISGAGSDVKSIAITERDVTDQKLADRQIKLLNENLQNNVIQLELSNKELESFSYSVSHDLRAPLRALNAYSQILEEDFTQEMSDEAKRMIKNIQANTVKMGTLIEDLLEFSRLGRKEVQKEMVNVNEMIADILQDINATAPYLCSIKVNELPPAYADRSLLKQVWINLISNAIKYSGKAAQPVIEIGSIASEIGTGYFIQDNGAGFDMAYADKLFGVFQRLHSAHDFPGTGVGLAIVYRIVVKHGGRIWANAKPGEGAAFYFTLKGNG